MNEAQVRTVEQVRQVLEGTQELEFRRAEDDEGRYGWIAAVLKRFDYCQLPRGDRAPVLAYLQRLSGYSRAQITRLVSRWVGGKALVKQYRAPENAFARRYTGADVALLVEVDRAMGTLSGPATKCVLRRQRDVFGDARFVRLGGVSVGHLYNLRNSAGYRAQRVVLPPATVLVGLLPPGWVGIGRFARSRGCLQTRAMSVPRLSMQPAISKTSRRATKPGGSAPDPRRRAAKREKIALEDLIRLEQRVAVRRLRMGGAELELYEARAGGQARPDRVARASEADRQRADVGRHHRDRVRWIDAGAWWQAIGALLHPRAGSAAPSNPGHPQGRARVVLQGRRDDGRQAPRHLDLQRG